MSQEPRDAAPAPATGSAYAPGAAHRPAYEEPDRLRDQVRQLLHYRRWIVLGLLVGLLAGGALAFAGSDDYASSSEVTLRQPTVDPFAAGGKPADAGISIESERQTAAGSGVAELAAKRLRDADGSASTPGLRELQKGLEVTNPPNTLILRFTYSADSAEKAADRANAFARAFLDDRRQQTEAEVGKMLKRYRDQRKPLQSLRGRSDSADAQLSVLDSKIADLKALDTTSGTVVRTALAPSGPDGPGLPLLLGLGAAVGLGLGLLGAWVRLVFDPRARSDGDVARALGAPVLGTLRRGGAQPLLASGRTAEEYRAMAFRLAYDRRLADGPRSLLVVAPHGSGETAAAVSVNLAAAFVEMDHDVLLVEADLRAPVLTDRLRAADGVRPGWARRPARGDGGWPTGLQIPVDAGESGAFDLVPGARVRNATRALSSAPATRLLETAGEPGATVVVHAPPVLAYADAAALADRVGGVVLVCNPREIRRADLARIHDLVTATGGAVLGAVLHTAPEGTPRRPAPLPRTSEATRAPALESDTVPLAGIGPGGRAAEPGPRGQRDAGGGGRARRR